VFLDLNFSKLLVLAVIALVVFGPERLPGLATQAGRMLRELRRMAEGAKTELQDSLGPEFSQFDIADLNPKNFVRKHLLDETNGDGTLGRPPDGNGVSPFAQAKATLGPEESPPYDAEAT
jgi:sec-independent protein translocase protein TatB